MVSQRPLRVSVLGFGGTWLRWNSRDPLWGLCWASVDLVSVEPGFGGTPETPYGVSVVWLRWIWLGWSGFSRTPETPYGVSVLGLRWIWLGWSGFSRTPETLKGLCLGLRSLDLASVELQRPHRGSLWPGFGWLALAGLAGFRGPLLITAVIRRPRRCIVHHRRSAVFNKPSAVFNKPSAVFNKCAGRCLIQTEDRSPCH